MPKNAAQLATPVAQEPTVSVSEAFGLPTDWSLKSSLNPAAKQSNEDVDDDGEDGDELPAEKTEDLPEKLEDEPEKKPEETVPPEKSEKKPVTEKKTVPEKAGKTKADKAPKTEASPKKEPAAVTPVVEPVPAKIKVGEKEYTPEELKALVEKANAPAPAVLVKPVVEPVTTAPKKDPTPEDIQRERAEVKVKDDKWVSEVAPHVDVSVDEATLDKILTGGADGVQAFKQTIASSVARAVLMTRKSMYAEIEPRFQQILEAQRPLISDREKAEDDRAWDSFQKTYPDLAKHRDLVETAANTLVKKEPDRVRGMSAEDFYKEVATNVSTFVSRFKEPASTTPPPAAAPKAEAAPGTPPAAAAAPAAPAKARVAPPGGNVPTPTGAGGGKKKGPDSDIISSLM